MSDQITEVSPISTLQSLRERVESITASNPDGAISVNLQKLSKLLKHAETEPNTRDIPSLLADVRSQIHAAEVSNRIINGEVPDPIRAWPETIQRAFLIARLKIDEAKQLLMLDDQKISSDYAICLSGAVGRFEAVSDSDLDYVLVFRDSALQKNFDAFISNINQKLYFSGLRPCDTYSCAWSLETLANPQNKFERYAIFTLLDSILLGGDQDFYNEIVGRIEKGLGEHAVNVDARSQAAKTLGWYIRREGWIDELDRGSTVNRMTRLVQLFITILSLKHLGIRETRATRPTWLRLDRVSDYLPLDQAGNARALWVRMLEMKETLGRIVLEDMAPAEKLLTKELWVFCQENYQI
jgi:hypothetical protein